MHPADIYIAVPVAKIFILTTLTKTPVSVWYSIQQAVMFLCKVFVHSLGISGLVTRHDRRTLLYTNLALSLTRQDHFKHWLPPTRPSLHERALKNYLAHAIPKCKTKRMLNRPMFYVCQIKSILMFTFNVCEVGKFSCSTSLLLHIVQRYNKIIIIVCYCKPI